MTIENLNSISTVTAATQATSYKSSGRAREAAERSTLTAPSGAAIDNAVKQLQSHLNGVGGSKPEFSVDYLSGLNVVRVLSTSGEVVRQLPSAQAVSLARLIASGNGGTEALAALDVSV